MKDSFGVELPKELPELPKRINGITIEGKTEYTRNAIVYEMLSEDWHDRLQAGFVADVIYRGRNVFVILRYLWKNEKEFGDNANQYLKELLQEVLNDYHVEPTGLNSSIEPRILFNAISDDSNSEILEDLGFDAITKGRLSKGHRINIHYSL
jgi:hypothetical protein